MVIINYLRINATIGNVKVKFLSLSKCSFNETELIVYLEHR